MNWLLILQGWAAMWVVIGHSPLNMDYMPPYVKFLFDFAYSFHMPLFILISGYLFQLTRLSKVELHNHNYYSFYIKTIWDKLMRLGIPYIVFTIIAILLKSIFSSSMNRPSELTINEFLTALINPFDGPLRAMWFILTIFWFFVFAPIWQWFTVNNKKSVILFTILILLYFFHPESNILCIKQICSMAIFFYSGILICKHGIEYKIKKQKYYYFVFGFFIYIISCILEIPLLSTWGAIIFSTCLAFICDEKLPFIFSSFKNYTYQIFLISIFPQIAIKILFNANNLTYSIGFILCIIVGIYIPILISKIVEKINSKILCISIGLKSYTNG